MSYQLILPFFPEELRELLLDPSISDLMINGVSGVFADRNGVMEHIELKTPYTTDRLQAAIERVARIHRELSRAAKARRQRVATRSLSC